MQVKLFTLALAAAVTTAPIFGSQGTGSFSDHRFHVDSELYAPAAADRRPAALAEADRIIVRALP